MHRSIPATLALLLLSVSACDGDVSDDQCNKFADHFSKLLAESSDASGIAKQRAEGIAGSLKESLVKSCKDDAKGSEVECILAAKSIKEVEEKCR